RWPARWPDLPQTAQPLHEGKAIAIVIQSVQGTSGSTELFRRMPQADWAGANGIAIEILMDRTDEARPSKRSQNGLDWLNFFIADVQTGFGPFVAVYLASLNWLQGQIGLLLTVSTLASIASQAPGGALVDAAASKRL